MDRKKFHFIYNDVMSLWPKTISIAKKVIFDDGGMRVEDFIKAHEHVDRHLEEKISFLAYQNDELSDWYRLVDWSIYQLLHSYIRESRKNIIKPHELLNEDEVLNRCLENKEFSSDWVE